MKGVVLLYLLKDIYLLKGEEVCTFIVAFGDTARSSMSKPWGKWAGWSEDLEKFIFSSSFFLR